MKPKNRWYANVLGFVSVSILFLGLGVYALSIFVGNRSSPPLLVGGLGCVALAGRMLWQVIQWVKPVEPVREKPSVCLFCGAVVEKGSDFCQKCGRPASG